MTLIRISPNGGKVKYLHNDKLHEALKEHVDMEINRATDIAYDNEEKVWRIRLVETNVLLVIPFNTREEALEYERRLLENDLRHRFDELAKQVGDN